MRRGDNSKSCKAFLSTPEQSHKASFMFVSTSCCLPCSARNELQHDLLHFVLGSTLAYERDIPPRGPENHAAIPRLITLLPRWVDDTCSTAHYWETSSKAPRKPHTVLKHRCLCVSTTPLTRALQPNMGFYIFWLGPRGIRRPPEGPPELGPCNKYWFLCFLSRARGGPWAAPREAPQNPPFPLAFPRSPGTSRRPPGPKTNLSPKT
jgi:hypothetical protein